MICCFLCKKRRRQKQGDVSGKGWGGSGLGGICLLAGQLGDLGSFALAPACSVLSSASRSLTSSNGLCFAPAPLLLPAHGCTLDGSFSGLAATAQCIRMGVMKDNFVFDRILHFS